MYRIYYTPSKSLIEVLNKHTYKRHGCEQYFNDILLILAEIRFAVTLLTHQKKISSLYFKQVIVKLINLLCFVLFL